MRFDLWHDSTTLPIHYLSNLWFENSHGCLYCKRESTLFWPFSVCVQSLPDSEYMICVYTCIRIFFTPERVNTVRGVSSSLCIILSTWCVYTTKILAHVCRFQLSKIVVYLSKFFTFVVKKWSWYPLALTLALAFLLMLALSYVRAREQMEFYVTKHCAHTHSLCLSVAISLSPPRLFSLLALSFSCSFSLCTRSRSRSRSCATSLALSLSPTHILSLSPSYTHTHPLSAPFSLCFPVFLLGNPPT